ncbi:MAG: DNA replication and repair protein RecF [Alistipes sp.]|nr:DNA replication and repair protein RecF [Alistipes sp.]
MILDKLSIINFKNICEEQLHLSRGINCFVGDNGAGKTNILDAVHYLSMARSMHTITDLQSVRHGEDGFIIDGRFVRDDQRAEQIVCGYTRRSGKTLKRNGKEYDKLSDHVGGIPIVVVSPGDTALISDSAEERRRYINRFISQTDRGYLNALIRYNNTLQERNKLLKSSPSEEMLLIYDAMLAQAAETIFARRSETIAAMQPLVEQYYAELAEERESIAMEYRSELQSASLQELLLQSRQRDFVNEFTSVGVHRDDILFSIGDYPLRKFGSQGQQKSFLIALKLAEYTLLAKCGEEKPMLLLDDLFDKLDMRRVAHLLHLVGGEMFGQIFITDCNKHRLERTLGEAGAEYKLFTISDGKAVTL